MWNMLRACALASLALAVACGQSSPAGDGAGAGGSGGGFGAAGGSVATGGGGAGNGSDASDDAPQIGGGAYPSGPYGTATGDVLANLELLGYVRDETTGLANEATLGATSLQAIRASTTKQHAVLHVSGFT